MRSRFCTLTNFMGSSLNQAKSVVQPALALAVSLSPVVRLALRGRVRSQRNRTRVLLTAKCYRRLESFELRCLPIQVTQRSEELFEFELNVFL